MKFKKAWIVDDDRVYVFSLKRLMKYVDFCDEVTTYGNGYEALNQLSLIVKRQVEPPPDVIILDINMPVWNGWEFLEFAKNLHLPENIKLFLVSSSTKDEDREKVKQYALVSEVLHQTGDY